MAHRNGNPQRSFNGRTSLSLASKKRLADARRLLETPGDPGRSNQHARGAKYLAGYAVECRLKVQAMEVDGCWTLDQLAEKWKVTHDVVYTHGLEAIAKRLPSWTRLSRNQTARRSFAHVNAWRPSWRYDGSDCTSDDAQCFLDSVLQVLHWLEFNR